MRSPRRSTGWSPTGWSSPAAAERLKKERRYYRGSLHPLQIVAEQKWKSAKPPHRLLALEPLTEWLARRVGMEYLHIDPLKVNLATVTEVMSSAYATRFRILPVAVGPKEVTIATAEPFVREWERELAAILKLGIRRVIANPADIERYQVEFYNLAKSVKSAAKGRPASRGCPTSSSWSSSAPRTGSSTRTTRTWCASSTGSGRTRSSNAQATSTSSRYEKSASRPLPHRRRAARGLPDPDASAHS
ncbi:MAG: hypothetical protein RML56_04630 [Burkholderiales bacterium]|nr:hypothetical protein [Burkholderiales bacterium]